VAREAAGPQPARQVEELVGPVLELEAQPDHVGRRREHAVHHGLELLERVEGYDGDVVAGPRRHCRDHPDAEVPEALSAFFVLGGRPELANRVRPTFRRVNGQIEENVFAEPEEPAEPTEGSPESPNDAG
jgi:hypothetical protein